MWIGARREISIILAMAAVCCALAASWAAAEPLQRRVPPHPKDARAAPAHGPPAHGPQAPSPQAPGPQAHGPQAHRPAAHGHAVTFRPPRGAAAADARRLGALVGRECTGRADMQRSEREWVVLCSNGRSYVVEPGVPHPAATPVECSLAGIGPEPACFP